MEASLCLRTPHFPALRPHGLAPLRRRPAAVRAEATPPPAEGGGAGSGSAARRRRPPHRGAVVSAGVVVLTCAAVGAACLRGCDGGMAGAAAARALQAPGARVGAPAAEWRQETGRAAQRMLDVLSEILLKRPAAPAELGGGRVGVLPERVYAEIYKELMPYSWRSDEKKTYTLADLLYEELTKGEYTPVERADGGQRLTSMLYKLWSATEEKERKYDIGLVLTLVLINQKDFHKAKEICQQIMSSRLIPPRDGRPYLHLAVINMMLAVEGMLSPDITSVDEIEKLVKSGVDAWKEFKNRHELRTD